MWSISIAPYIMSNETNLAFRVLQIWQEAFNRSLWEITKRFCTYLLTQKDIQTKSSLSPLPSLGLTLFFNVFDSSPFSVSYCHLCKTIRLCEIGPFLEVVCASKDPPEHYCHHKVLACCCGRLYLSNPVLSVCCRWWKGMENNKSNWSQAEVALYSLIRSLAHPRFSFIFQYSPFGKRSSSTNILN